ncbi:hypothetical protein H0H93_009344 [Arthromyces matolae]|nr:hypothetical protein H0H93_009344 [Arthromyces matolae]
MKISTIHILFPFIFAFAASSTPVFQHHALYTIPEESSKLPQSSPSEYPSEIFGKAYSANDVKLALELWDDTLERKSHPSPEALAKAQRLAIEAILSSHANDPDLNRNYNAMRLDLHKFMKALVSNVLRPAYRLVDDPEVVLAAQDALETCFQWERMHNYDQIYHVRRGRRRLDDDEYLQALETALIRIIIEDEAARKGDNDPEMRLAPHRGKRKDGHDRRFIRVSMLI